MQEKIIKYYVNNIEFEAYCVYKKSNQPKPAILVAPDYAGRGKSSCDVAKKLANCGYIGVAIDVYGGAKVGSGKEECMSLMSPLLENRDLLNQRLRAALESVQNLSEVDSNKISAIGFCFGGPYSGAEQ